MTEAKQDSICEAHGDMYQIRVFSAVLIPPVLVSLVRRAGAVSMVTFCVCVCARAHARARV